MGLVDSLFEKVPRKFSKGRCSPYESDVVFVVVLMLIFFLSFVDRVLVEVMYTNVL
ncbi:hypothetical protein YC2023_082944 [Brassica napus]